MFFYKMANKQYHKSIVYEFLDFINKANRCKDKVIYIFFLKKQIIFIVKIKNIMIGFL